MNRKSEFGHNHINRLEANLSHWDMEMKQAADISNKKCDRQNLCQFIDVIKNVATRVQENETISCYRLTNSSKRKVVGAVNSLYVGGDQKRRKHNMETSTPKWEHRSKPEVLDDSSSHQGSPPLLNFSNGSFSSSREDSITRERTLKIGLDFDDSIELSSQIRKLLISPVNEDEYTEMKRLLQETINLTRAAIGRGIMYWR